METEEISFLQYNNGNTFLMEQDHNIGNLLLEDGSVARPNGTLININDQPLLLLQDGNCFEPVSVSDNQEQLFHILAPQNMIDEFNNIFHYVQNNDNNSLASSEQPQLFYIQDGSKLFDQSQMETPNLMDNGILSGDLEQMLSQQQSEDSTINLLDFQNRLFGLEIELPTQIKGRPVEAGEIFTLNDTKEKAKFENELLRSKGSVTDNLKGLINKKITIGQTEKGKTLIGKIVNVIKKPEKKQSVDDSNNNYLTKGKTFSNNCSTLEQLSKCSLNRLENKSNLNLPKITDSTLIGKKIATIKDETPVSKESAITDAVCEDISFPRPLENLNINSNSISLKKNISDIQSENDPNQSSIQEHSKLIVHNKVVSKDSFDIIVRTMSGLMNLDSMVEKLKNKIIILKIIEQKYNNNKRCDSKSISYCSGYMMKECELNIEDHSFTESWKFILDANSKEIILGGDKAPEEKSHEGSSQTKKFVNITLHLITDAGGMRTTKVILGTPALYKCKICLRSFRTSTLLRIHTLSRHPTSYFGCAQCQRQFKTENEAKDHLKKHHKTVATFKRPTYDCLECNKNFDTIAQTLKHMDQHTSSTTCPICKINWPDANERRKHMLLHSRIKHSNGTAKIEKISRFDKIFRCNVCARQFSRHSNLQRHSDIHKGEGAMYQCALCGCSYHYISSLTRHILSCHVSKSKTVLEKSFIANNSQFYSDDQIVPFAEDSIENDQLSKMPVNINQFFDLK